jgi:hypothetical protein
MLDGNRFFPETGMPILNRERKMVVFAVWLPEPFTVPTVMEKSLMIFPVMVLLLEVLLFL